jgi:hypothetical protein
MYLLKWMGLEKPYVKLKVHNSISCLFLYSVYQERNILTCVSTTRPSFPLSSQHRCLQRAPRHSLSGHAVFATPVPCRTVAVLLQASGRLSYFHSTQPYSKQEWEKAWGILRLYKKRCTSMKLTGKEKAISYSGHIRLWVATYSLVYWQLQLAKYILIIWSGFRVPRFDRHHKNKIVNSSA